MSTRFAIEATVLRLADEIGAEVKFKQYFPKLRSEAIHEKLKPWKVHGRTVHSKLISIAAGRHFIRFEIQRLDASVSVHASGLKPTFRTWHDEVFEIKIENYASNRDKIDAVLEIALDALDEMAEKYERDARRFEADDEPTRSTWSGKLAGEKVKISSRSRSVALHLVDAAIAATGDPRWLQRSGWRICDRRTPA